jgi:trehalose 6-phosphate phosphatase
VTGRRSEEAAALLPVRGLEIVGVYGLQGAGAELPAGVLPLIEAAAEAVPEAWVEPKGVSIAVHYRQAADPVAAREALLDAIGPVAAGARLELVEGKMVLELSPPDRPMKGGSIERAVERSGLQAALYAGDDLADLDAFAGLDRLAAREVDTVRVAVRGTETPVALVEAADEVVEGPTGLLELLRGLL